MNFFKHGDKVVAEVKNTLWVGTFVGAAQLLDGKRYGLGETSGGYIFMTEMKNFSPYTGDTVEEARMKVVMQ